MTISEYFEALKKLQEEHGPRSVVLMQEGSFYEIYGVDTPNLKIGHISEVSKILGMKIALKKGKNLPIDINHPKMVGFPDYAIHNHLHKLISPPSGEPGFIVAQYDQVGSNKKGKIRELIEIFGPSSITNDDFDSDIKSKYSMCIIIDHYMCPIYKEKINYMDLALINLITGDIYLYELYNTHSDSFKIKTDLNRIFNSYNIVEVLIPKNFEAIKDVIPSKTRITIPQKLDKEYFNISFQEAFLNEIYPENEILESLKGIQVIPPLIVLLNYISKYNPNIKKKLKLPILLEESNNLILNNDSIIQLHLFPLNPGDKYNLFYILNHTKTSMGERLLKQRLSLPEIDTNVINERYDQISKCMELSDADRKKYQEELKGIIDIDKKYRKWVLTCEGSTSSTFQPYEFEHLYSSFLKILTIFTLAGAQVVEIKDSLLTQFKCFINEIEEIFDFEAIKENDKTKNYFKIEIPELNDIFKNVSQAKSILESINREISLLTGASRLEKTEKEGYYINLTKSKYKASGNLESFSISVIFNDKEYTVNNENIMRSVLTNTIKISSPFIKMLSNIISEAENQIEEILRKKFIQILNELLEKDYGQLIITVSNIIAEIDLIICNTCSSLKYGYVKPEIIDEKNGTSFIIATDLRHPVVEYHSDHQYISNDIELYDSGLVLYGLNLAGKSTFLRSVGISIVMAQAGLFVPASSFIYYPFKRLISKISIKDEPEKNMSTFMVEISEIKDICERANENTLVILDESGSSTELYSGTALVASLINFLTLHNASFIVSTHLNELQDLDIIKDNEKVIINHFNVTVPPGGGEIKLDRKIKSGGMNKLYGLEIAGALGLQTEILKTAFDIRNEFTGDTGEILSTKKSRYNSKVYVNHCDYCGSKKDLQTHHIRHQAEANEYGLIDDNFHKNKKFNLIVVCKKCHDRIHNEL